MSGEAREKMAGEPQELTSTEEHRLSTLIINLLGMQQELLKESNRLIMEHLEIYRRHAARWDSIVKIAVGKMDRRDHPLLSLTGKELIKKMEDEVLSEDLRKDDLRKTTFAKMEQEALSEDLSKKRLRKNRIASNP